MTKVPVEFTAKNKSLKGWQFHHYGKVAPTQGASRPRPASSFKGIDKVRRILCLVIILAVAAEARLLGGSREPRPPSRGPGTLTLTPGPEAIA